MERSRSCEIASRVGQRVRVAGWLHSVRRMGALQFIVVRDGWGVVQAVATAAEAAALAEVQLESIVELEGTVVAEPQLELHEPVIRVTEPVREQPPVLLAKKQLALPLPALLDHAVVANRHPTRRKIFQIAAAAMRGFRTALDREGFTEIQSPKLVGGATEGGANVFAVKYFDRTAYLAQSPQLYKQIMVGVFERVYEVGPVFRAEPHDTARHINQYTSLDVELGFIASHLDVMAQLTRVLREMFEHVRPFTAVPEVPAEIPAIHFTEARERLAAVHGAHVLAEPDLSPEGERWLGEWAKREHASDFLFVVGYPLAKRPFYTHPDPARPEYSASFDLLFRGTELVTGGQRLHRHADYLAALAARGMPAEPFVQYLEAFRNGMPPHGGFAIGLERFVMQLLGLPNIRLAVLFPRDLTRLAP
ncbi:MAG TPA: aspartate--tRNA(Asn) ligase [Kofleriaceae bacterium]|nr:aspartate--tRNA(Asn) ligase [Kofleriaceae bacterium]